ncbi:MAG: hypothetical protein RLZ18_1177 [Actinomycetota bacterium]
MQLTLGPLQQFLDRDDVNEVMVLCGEHIYIETPRGIQRVGSLLPDELALCVERIARASGRRIDLLAPVLDARLTDGSRACVVIAPIAVDGTTIAIRKFPQRTYPLTAFGPSSCAAVVRQLIAERLNVVVSGATSSGKTSLLSAVIQTLPASERIVCAEDTAELRAAHPHIVRLQTRPSNSEGVGAVDLQQLVKASLRLRPDRLIVGEVRGSETIDMLLALTSGHRGCWSTVHANSATDAVRRLSSIVLRDAPQWTPESVSALVLSSIDAVIHISRSGHRRLITEIVDMRTGTPTSLYTSPNDD